MMAYVITFLWGMVAGYSLTYLVVRKQAMKIQREVDAFRKERQDILELLLQFKEGIEKEMGGASRK